MAIQELANACCVANTSPWPVYIHFGRRKSNKLVIPPAMYQCLGWNGYIYIFYRNSYIYICNYIQSQKQFLEEETFLSPILQGGNQGTKGLSQLPKFTH